ncbi:hypothetical protein ACFZAD_24420 [Streptomyces iakyrus]|uniref:hypothetical protein n=1 Tax=Streptomyces iakyrus TaxID=68219 RepID=UPI0036EF8CA1
MTPKQLPESEELGIGLSEDEMFEAEYKLQNCIRVTLNVESYITEVYTGSRFVPVTEYVVALIRQQKEELLDRLEEESKKYGEHYWEMESFIEAEREKL